MMHSSANTQRLAVVRLLLMVSLLAYLTSGFAIAQDPTGSAIVSPYQSAEANAPTFLPPITQQFATPSNSTSLGAPQSTPYTVPVQAWQQTYGQAAQTNQQFMQQTANQAPPYAQAIPSTTADAQIAANQFPPYASPPQPLPYTMPPDGSGAIGSGAAEESLPPPPDAVPSSIPSLDQSDLDSASMTPIGSQAFEPEPQYAWYQYPWVLIPRDGWDSSIEFGLNGSDGNANSLSYAAGADLTRKGKIYNLNVNLDYRKTNADGVNTQDNARANFDLDRAIAESAMSAFIKSGLEYDVFKAFDARVNVNSGLSYFWANSDDVTFVTRIGAGASQEIGAADEDWKPEMLFGLDLKQQVNDRNRVFVKVDYFPAFEDFTDYRVITDAGWEILLDDADNFSLKLAATNRYDSTPLGLKPQDIDYTATLLYKF